MPIIKSAKKKMRQDKRRQQRNDSVEVLMKTALKKARKSGTLVTVTAAQSAIDTAVKKKVIHKHKAARLKSQLAKKIGSKK